MEKTQKVELYKETAEADCNLIRKKMLIIYFVSLAFMLAAIVCIFIFMRIKYPAATKILVVLLTIIFSAASYFFFSIKFRLTNAYCKLLKFFRTGLMEESRVKFISFDDTDTDKDGVTFYSIVVHEKVKKRPDMPERHILIDKTLPKPDFREGDVILAYTKGNILIKFSILDEVF